MRPKEVSISTYYPILSPAFVLCVSYISLAFFSKEANLKYRGHFGVSICGRGQDPGFVSEICPLTSNFLTFSGLQWLFSFTFCNLLEFCQDSWTKVSVVEHVGMSICIKCLSVIRDWPVISEIKFFLSMFTGKIDKYCAPGKTSQACWYVKENGSSPPTLRSLCISALKKISLQVLIS